MRKQFHSLHSGGLLFALLAAVALTACDPILVREFRVAPDQVGTSTLEAKASSVLAQFDMLPLDEADPNTFGFRRQWPNLGTGRPGEMSVTFALESTGNAWLVRLRQWPVAHQTRYGANVETALMDELAHSGYTVSGLR